MRRLTQRDGGLFPKPAEIKMTCSCPDWAGMCKHVAATLYGVGVRLDTAPELLFTLRNVDHLELIGRAVDADNLDRTLQGKADNVLAGADLGAVFGIELDTGNGVRDEAGKVAAGVAQDSRRRGQRKPAPLSGEGKPAVRKRATEALVERAPRRGKKPARAERKTRAGCMSSSK